MDATTTTRFATRSSRRRPTTTSCPVSGSASTVRSPRPLPSALREVARSPPDTGPNLRTTGRPPATTATPSRRRSGPARRPRAPSPSPTRGGRTSVPSSCGRRSMGRRSWPGSIASRCSTAPPSRPGCPATPAARSSCAVRPSSRSVRMPTRSGSGRCSSSSVGRCGPTARREDALEAHEEAVAIMPADPPTPARARVLSGYGQILMLLDRWTESMALCEQAVEMAREVGARQVEGHALNTLGLDLAVSGDCAGRSRRSRRRSRSPGRSPTRTTSVAGTSTWARQSAIAATSRGAVETVREGVVVADEVGVTRTYGHVHPRERRRVRLRAGRMGRRPAAGRRRASPSSRRWPARRALRPDRAGCRCSSPRATNEPGHARGAPQHARRVPVETQFHNPFRGRRGRTALWRGEPDVRLASIMAGLRETEGREWPRYQLRLFRMGMRGRGGSRRGGPRPSRRCRGGCGDPLRRRASGRPCSRSSTPASRAAMASITRRTRRRSPPIEAERARLKHEPAVALWADAMERWRTQENPYLVAYGAWRQAEALLGDGDRAAAAASLRRGTPHRDGAWVRARSSRPSRLSQRGPASTCRPTATRPWRPRRMPTGRRTTRSD